MHETDVVQLEPASVMLLWPMHQEKCRQLDQFGLTRLKSHMILLILIHALQSPWFL